MKQGKLLLLICIVLTGVESVNAQTKPEDTSWNYGSLSFADAMSGTERANTWEEELVKDIKPARLSGLSVTLPFKVGVIKTTFYDPWTDKETILKNGNMIALPNFEYCQINY